MQKLTIIAPDGKQLEIFKKPYWLSGLVGLSDAPVNLLYDEGYAQDGQTPAGQQLMPRQVSFAVTVVGDDLADMYQKRRALASHLNPKRIYMVIYQNDYMTVRFSCRVSLPPTSEPKQTSGALPRNICTVALRLDDPYLYDAQETTVPMAIETPMLVFPVFFPPEGIPFSTISNKRVVINNIGDVPTPLRIVFYGGSVDPVIKNETTGQFVRVTHTVAPDDLLEIRTGYNDKRVEIIKPDGTRENAFHFIDTDSEFFDLLPGENELVYDAQSGSDSAMVYVYYSNRYVGV